MPAPPASSTVTTRPVHVLITAGTVALGTDRSRGRPRRAGPLFRPAGSALAHVGAGGHLGAVGELADPEVVEDVAGHPLQLAEARDGQLADLDVGVLAGPHGDEVPPGAVVPGDDDPRLRRVRQDGAGGLPGLLA